jgi:tape measure domain-containing protein
MAFLGDLIVKMGANISPFQSAIKKAQNVTAALKSSLTDMRTTADVFAKLAASIKATNNQMDRLVSVSKGALAATQSLSAVELAQSRNRLQQLKMIQSQQQHNMKMQQLQAGGGQQGGSLMGAGLAGGIGGALTGGVMGLASSGVGFVKDMAVAAVNLAADAETARITFEVLVGDAEKGRKLFKDIEKFAARTSFDFASASDAVKGLLAAGVGEGDVLSTMQLLGDLAMGDANKLGFLSKAYTDVMNKGKLQGQELRQFAENGVGLARALADTMKISVSEVQALSEEGKISFRDVQKALASLTGEGGRFNGMMDRINKTFTGQWNSLIEQIQTIGRDLGALVLPMLTQIVSETNKFLQGFMAIEDKGKFIGDLLEASADVGIEAIREHWEKALDEMIQMAWDAGKKIALNLDPVAAAARFAGGAIGRSIDGQGAKAGQSPLQAAQDKLAAVMQRAKDAVPPAEQIKPISPESKIGDVLTGVFDSLKPVADKAIGAVQSKIESAKLTGNWFSETAKNLIGDKIKKESPVKDEADREFKLETKLAGAMNRGSAEAYSTIVNAMRGNKDPQVKAIDKSTKAIVAAVKANKPQHVNVVSAFG